MKIKRRDRMRQVILADVLRFLMRAAHTGAFAVWLGSGFFFILTRSVRRSLPAQDGWAAYSLKLRAVVRPSFAVLVASGMYLTLDRLAEPRLGSLYVLVLAAKVGIVAAIAWLAGGRGSPRPSTRPYAMWRDPAWVVLVLGAGALVLGVLLTSIYEAEVGRPASF